MRSSVERFLLRLVVGVAVMGAAAAATAQPLSTRTINTEAGKIEVETLVRGLDHPWGMDMIPDGLILITERSGQIRIYGTDGKLSPPLKGVPPVWASGQGGMLDIALDPHFDTNGTIYWCYSEKDDTGVGTAVARGRMAVTALEKVQVIFRQQPKVTGPNHFGCRLAFARDGRLFVTLGERFTFSPAQNLDNTLGKVVRIDTRGEVPADNPFVGRKDARPEIWSLGHRNPQGAAIHPQTGALWISEFGPAGGDEINIVRPGGNYGWPLVSWGEHYNGDPIPRPSTRPEFIDAIYHWTPSVSPSGIAFATYDTFRGWKGNLLVAGLSSESLIRLTLDGEKVTHEERIEMGERVRDVMEGVDATIYLLTDDDDGKLLRLVPAE